MAPEDDEGIYADTLITIGLIIMLLALLAALGFFLSQVALRDASDQARVRTALD